MLMPLLPSMLWRANYQDARKTRMVEMLSELHLYTLNDVDSPPTFRRLVEEVMLT